MSAFPVRLVTSLRYGSAGLLDDSGHVLAIEGSHGGGPDVPESRELQCDRREGLLIRGVNDRDDVVLPEGPVDVLQGPSVPLDQLGEGIRPLRGVLEVPDALVSPVD